MDTAKKGKEAASVFMLSVCVCFSLIKFGKQKLQAHEIIHLVWFGLHMKWTRAQLSKEREIEERLNRGTVEKSLC